MKPKHIMKSAFCAMLLTLGALPGTAYADHSGTVNVGHGHHANLRDGPGTGSDIIGSLPDGAVINIVCTMSGDSVTGTYGTSAVWDMLDTGQWRRLLRARGPRLTVTQAAGASWPRSPA